VAPLGLSGAVQAGDPAAAPAVKWRGSIFEAPVAAAVGSTWRRDLALTDPVQRRHSAMAAQILGLSLELDAIAVEQIRGVLELPGLDHQKARRDFASAANGASRARALVPLLGAVVFDATLWPRILGAGFLAGVWGRPAIFDARTAIVFPAPGTAHAAALRKTAVTPHEFVPHPPGDPPNLSPSSSTTREVTPPCTDIPSE
jgi:hypothetical protein